MTIKISDEAIRSVSAALEQAGGRGQWVSFDELARVAIEAVAPLIAAQVLQPDAIAALYDFWRYFHYYAGGYDAESIGLVTAYDRDDSFEFDRLSDLVEPHEPVIRAALGRPGAHDTGATVEHP